jgi:hypothetical protein
VTATESPDTVAVRASRQRRRGWVLLAIAAWNVWLWVTRIRNLMDGADDFSAAFVGVHAVLYVGSLALAGVLAVMGVRMLREARAGETARGSGS